MGKFIISESEKQRILEMHKNATRKQYLMEKDIEDGTVLAQAREQSLIDGTKGDITSIGFSINGDPNRRQYFYTCVPSFNSTQAEIKDVNVAGAMYDANNTLFTAADLGLKGNYNQEFRNACSNIYAVIAKKRETFCVNPKNKTKPNFAWNCPQYTDEAKAAAAAAEAESQAAAQATAQAEKDKAEAAAKKAADDKAELEKQAAQQAVSAANRKKALEVLGNYPVEIRDAYDALANAIDKEGGTQADVEAKIDAINAVINNPNQHYKHYLYLSDIENVPKEGGNFQKKGGYKTYINRYMTRAKEKFPNLSKTVDVTNLTTATYPPKQESTNENYYRDYFKKFIL